MDPELEDRNSRGIGLLLRLLGVVLPAGVVIGLSFGLRGVRVDIPPNVAAVFQVIAFLWAWPYHMYRESPVGFGAFALISVAVALVLLARHDRRGWVFTLLFSLMLGGFVATLAGQD